MSVQSKPANAAAKADWSSIASAFHVLSARDLLAADRMERHQEIKHRMRWLAPDEAPLIFLFISHRWETLAHPDPSGRQHKAIQDLLRAICMCAEAVLVPGDERLRLVPSVDREGTLQAVEIVRRALGFGPFSDHPLGVAGKGARKLLEDALALHEGRRDLFRDWLAGMIGVWVDYTCMPQQPLAEKEDAEFRQTLRDLDKLAQASIVVALRDSRDDYAVRGWCASEFFLGSARSFSRSLFVDMGRLTSKEPVRTPSPPEPTNAATPAAEVMRSSYESDSSAWRSVLKEWALPAQPLAHHHIPDLWASYRDLQGSTFADSATDANPFRRVLDAISGLETSLVQGWLMTNRPWTLDIAAAVQQSMQQQGLGCAKDSDLVYLGLLVACQGWINAFRPLFRECLRRYVDAIDLSQHAATNAPRLTVTLMPLDERTRNAFSSIEQRSAAIWYSRLRSGDVGDPRERAAVCQIQEGLARQPARYVFAGRNG